jgi:hypothetical protein
VFAGNDEVGEIEFGGEVPLVELTSGVSTASGASGPTFSWNVADGDSAEHTFWLELSRDGGATWKTVAPRFTGEALALDPSVVGGGDNLMLRVLASDGANTGVATSEPFSLDAQAPQGAIVSPGNGASFGPGDLVWLQSAVFDTEDGFLDGNSVEWSSSRDGSLGTSASLAVYDLSEGTHTITMTAIDSDDNEVTDSITVAVGAGGALTWGDWNCSGTADPLDAFLTLRFDAGLTASTGECPSLGEVVEVAGASPHAWGDADCDGAVTSVDSLRLLRHDADLAASQEPECPAIGSPVLVEA